MIQPSLFSLDDGPPGELAIQRVNQLTAKIPCEHWHYAGKLPSMITDVFGVWELGVFQGVLVFGFPVSQYAGRMFGLSDNQHIRELLRIALRGHCSTLTSIMSRILRQFKLDNPSVELVISYADPNAGHHGGIYQAASWVYLGEFPPRPRIRAFTIRGETLHSRTAGHRYGRNNYQWLKDNVDPDLVGVVWPRKHKYAFGFNRRIRKLLLGMAEPYPKDDCREE